MPRRDVVLTGLLAFGAGVAVGANWGKLRKKIGPLLEKWGLQMADLGDFLSANGLGEFAAETMEAEFTKPRARTSRRSKANVTPVTSRRRDKSATVPGARPAPKRKAPRRKPIILSEEEAPLATGTYAH